MQHVDAKMYIKLKFQIFGLEGSVNIFKFNLGKIGI